MWNAYYPHLNFCLNIGSHLPCKVAPLLLKENRNHLKFYQIFLRGKDLKQVNFGNSSPHTWIQMTLNRGLYSFLFLIFPMTHLFFLPDIILPDHDASSAPLLRYTSFRRVLFFPKIFLSRLSRCCFASPSWLLRLFSSLLESSRLSVHLVYI